tara:strand:+ start:4088 stop:4429 length:342 start_codon:yes stop_codon:yes gene_type:complete
MKDIIQGSLTGMTWPGGNTTLVSDEVTLVDVAGSDGDCPQAAAADILDGEMITVHFENEEGAQFPFDLDLTDFDRAEEALLNANYKAQCRYCLQRDILLVACWGALVIPKGGF